MAETGFAARWRARVRAVKDALPALMLAMRDPRTPRAARWLAGAAVAYALSPLDLLPDFIPVFGFLDDVLILGGLIWLAVRRIPAPVWADCRARATNLWAAGGRARWRYAIPVIIAWLAFGALILWIFLH